MSFYSLDIAHVTTFQTLSSSILQVTGGGLGTSLTCMADCVVMSQHSSLPDMWADGLLVCVFFSFCQAYCIHLLLQDAPPVGLYSGQHTQVVWHCQVRQQVVGYCLETSPYSGDVKIQITAQVPAITSGALL